MKKMKVVVGMSGGVDSSVAAWLLKEQGHDVIGMFMRNWHDDELIIDNECPWIQDSNDALIVAEQLNIPFHVIDLSDEYHERIVEYMYKEYKAGRTPNPDVLCNREIKFDIFLEKAKKLGADKVATGHYAHIMRHVNASTHNITRQLHKASDPSKDQSYFLCQLNQEQLSQIVFPLGGLFKSQVREIARKYKLATADKKDSQGLCFVGKIKLPEFLSKRISPKQGDVVNFETKEVIGQHNGAYYFTVGQRRGLGISGKDKVYYVKETDVDNNIVYVLPSEHPLLYSSGLFIPIDDFHWVNPKRQLLNPMKVTFQIRYRGEYHEGKLSYNSGEYDGQDGWWLNFNKPIQGLTSGQFVAIYIATELIASGIIDTEYSELSTNHELEFAGN